MGNAKISAYQPNLICAICFNGSPHGTFCSAGWKPEACTHYQPKYKCPGGMIFDHEVTQEECRECASTCKGCLKMTIAYGFLDKEKVAHLL